MFHSLSPIRRASLRTFSTSSKMRPSLVVFDKDGTLIDFNLMWSSWVEQFAWRLENTANLPVRERLFDLMGYDYTIRSVRSKGALCCTPMHQLKSLGYQVLEENALNTQQARELVDGIWHMPDPRASARPLTDLKVLFNTIQSMNIKIAVCTTDDHDATKITLDHLGVADMVDCVVGGDDLIAPKPSPEQLWYICNKLDVDPQNTVMVGDTNTDMAMGKAAGVGLNVGIMDGASSLADLSTNADILIPELSKITKILFQYNRQYAATQVPRD